MSFAQQESEVETLQNALQEAMTRERQLIQEKAQKEDEMKQQRAASKQYIQVLMTEKQALQNELEALKQSKPSNMSTKPPLAPPPSAPSTISPLKKLENEKEQIQNDLQRVLSKLSQREHEHNQFTDEISKLRRSLTDKVSECANYKQKLEDIEKQYRITSDKLETMQQKVENADTTATKFHETQTILKSITEELKALRETHKITIQEKENLKDELNTKQQSIDELKGKIEKYSLKTTNLSATIQELNGKLEELSKKGKDQINDLIEQNEEYKQQIHSLTEQLEQTQTEQKQANESHMETVRELQQTIESLTEINDGLESKHKQQIEEKDKKINELDLEIKITEKKQNKLIRELKDQLKKEVIKSQELKCNILKLNDEIREKEVNLEKYLQTHSALNNTLANSQNNGSVNMNEHNNIKPIAKSSQSPFVEVEVSNALAKKLENEVQSNYALKEQIKYLSECIQQLHIDLDNKKTVIKNLTKRIDIGALPSIDHQNNNKYAPTQKKQYQLSQLEVLMQETTLQNAMLRKDLELMGRALQDSNDKIKTLENAKTKQNNKRNKPSC